MQRQLPRQVAYASGINSVSAEGRAPSHCKGKHGLLYVVNWSISKHGRGRTLMTRGEVFVEEGILKNSSSYQHISSETHVSPTSERTPVAQHQDIPSASPTISAPESSRPSIPTREFSEKDITQLNTERNAGEHRRTNSNPRASLSRRQSSQSGEASEALDNEQGQRLKWDEANLYLNEGQMGGKMKIDEPKTPFVHSQDLLDRDMEEETSTLNPEDLAVDELEMDKSRLKSKKGGSAAQNDIPDIDIGQPEMEMQPEPAPSLPRRESDALDRKVSLGGDPMDLDGYHHGEHEETLTGEELEKHRKFEEMRKKHYEMKNIKDLLGHPEALDEDEDDEGKR
ncbi:hypothetical protein B0A54_07626 [Friedmanniomyces endolithicus]|uniref:Glc8 protein n=1 Tax=Friedmanniomyces endolithicus TaxID=329885 RepID=A0A4U0V0K1_9PEZI|nr:hypothetical protein B0A54_07626 [Friedmanniomyces endolithicus]